MTATGAQAKEPSRGWRTIATSALVVALVGCAPTPPPRDPFSANGRLIALSGGDAGPDFACFGCHGLDGSGDGIATPRLAGLSAGHLLKQLQDYADGRRRHAPMSAIAAALGPEDRRAVAFYYAALPASVRTPARRSFSAKARMLYHAGDPRRGLAACASCHGALGEGAGAANPPLAGQPPAYLADQLRRWRLGERRSDPRDLMLQISRRLTAAEAAALAEYAARLPGSPARAGAAPAPSP